MNDHASTWFWNATVSDLKRGYVYDEKDQSFTCIVCGERFLKGVIYPHDGVLFEAEKFAQVHIASKHDSMFHVLLELEKKVTGLTEHQKEFLMCFYRGVSDKEIVQNMGGSVSTVRTQRFSLRERAKQAKVFLTIMELVEEKSHGQPAFIPVHRSAKMVDERYAITEEENEQILKTYFPDGPDQKLREFPKKQKRKLAILRHIANKFERGTTYTEPQVNEILKEIYDDYVTIRRYLIEYGFMDRVKDCSSYWVTQ